MYLSVCCENGEKPPTAISRAAAVGHIKTRITASFARLLAAPARSESGVNTASHRNNLRGKGVPANRATVACRKDMSGTCTYLEHALGAQRMLAGPGDLPPDNGRVALARGRLPGGPQPSQWLGIRQRPLQGERVARGIAAGGDDVEVGARLLERKRLDVSFGGRRPGPWASASLRNCCARWRRSVGVAVFDVPRGLRRASAAALFVPTRRGCCAFAR